MTYLMEKDQYNDTYTVLSIIQRVDSMWTTSVKILDGRKEIHITMMNTPSPTK